MTLFEIVFHLCHELIRRRPIDDPMVERQAEIAHWANRDRIVDDDGSFLNCTDTQNGDLRLMNDGGAEQAAEPAMIRDRERSALNLFGVQFLGPGSFREIRNFFCQLSQSFSIGISHHRHQESVFKCRGDSHMDIFFDHDALLAT